MSELAEIHEPIAVSHPPDLITMAIQKGMDADSIAKLVDLLERKEQQKAERAFADAMRLVQEKCGVILKSKMGGKARYAPLDEVNYTIKPIYTGAGFALSFAEADCKLDGWKRTVCDVRHRDGHTVRYHIDLPLDGAESKGGMNSIQGAISTGSYAQRVLICRIFNLTIALTDLDGGRPNEPISDDQLAEIDALWEQVQDRLGRKLKIAAFVTAFGGPEAETTRDFTQQQYAEAVKDLKRQLKGGAK